MRIGRLKAILASALLLTVACGRKHAATAVPSMVNPADTSYSDLQPGDRLRVVIPLVTSDGYRPALEPSKVEANTITLSAANLVGYEMVYYTAERARSGRVRLRFASATVSKDGNTVPNQPAPKLPFAMPSEPEHVRVLYLIRSSRADHNMAILAARSTQRLDAFTAQLRNDPALCEQARNVFCTWVPAGIAVRRETTGSDD